MTVWVCAINPRLYKHQKVLFTLSHVSVGCSVYVVRVGGRWVASRLGGRVGYLTIEGHKTQGAQLAGGRLSKLIWGSGDGKKRVRCHATTERALRYPTQVSLNMGNGCGKCADDARRWRSC